MVPMCSSDVQRFFDSLYDGGMAVAGHQRAKAKVVVDIFVAVNVADFAALPFFDEDGIRVVRAIVACYAQGNALQRPRVGFRGFRRPLLVNRDFLL